MYALSRKCIGYTDALADAITKAGAALLRGSRKDYPVRLSISRADYYFTYQSLMLGLTFFSANGIGK